MGRSKRLCCWSGAWTSEVFWGLQDPKLKELLAQSIKTKKKASKKKKSGGAGDVPAEA